MDYVNSVFQLVFLFLSPGTEQKQAIYKKKKKKKKKKEKKNWRPFWTKKKKEEKKIKTTTVCSLSLQARQSVDKKLVLREERKRDRQLKGLPTKDQKQGIYTHTI